LSFRYLLNLQLRIKYCVAKVKNDEELQNAIEVALLFDRKVIVEEDFEGREINISVMGNSGSNLETSVCEEVFPSKIC